MKTLAVYNIKGGVGKTTATVNLAYHASRAGARVLVWDLDPQSAATFYFRVQAHIEGGGKQLVRGKTELTAQIRGTDFPNLELLPADFSYRHMDRVLSRSDAPRERLRDLLKPLHSRYDCVLFDCPPSISLVSESVFAASDVLLVPMIPTTLSLRTLNQLSAFRNERPHLRNLRVLPFLSMVDRRKRLHRDLLERLAAERDDFLKTHIPYASEAEKMGIHRAPIASFAARSPAALAFEQLWDEVQQQLYEPPLPQNGQPQPMPATGRPCVICASPLAPGTRGMHCANCGYAEDE